MRRIGVCFALCLSLVALGDKEGPRQKATLLEGMGKVSFSISSKSKDAQSFFNQGVAQLHGFWNYEAERSFRQVVKLDPDSPMGYWGLAMATILQPERAANFTKEAEKRTKNGDKREGIWVAAMTALFSRGVPIPFAAKKAHVDALADLVVDYPNDVDARAFLVLARHVHLKDAPAQLVEVIDGVLKDQSEHPSQQYKVMLHTGPNAAKALDAAKACGPSAPGIANLWHAGSLPYWDLKEYHLSGWQKEAATRVDNAYFEKVGTMPFLNPDYLHNAAWLVGNHMMTGRISEAVTLAKNLIRLPSHPRSAWTRATAQQLLIATLYQGELWDDAIALAKTKFLDTTNDIYVALGRHRLVAVAHLHKKDRPALEKEIVSLKTTVDDIKKAIRAEDVKGFEKLAEHRIGELEAYVDVAKGDIQKGLDRLQVGESAHLYPILLEADAEKFKERAKQSVMQFFPAGTAGATALAKKLYVADKVKDAAKVGETVKDLVRVSGTVEQKHGVFSRLDAVMKAQGQPADWGTKTPPKFEGRPDVTKLGPLLWAPRVVAHETKKSTVLVLLPSDKQNEVLKELTPHFVKAGIEVVTVTDTKHAAFQTHRAYDDFEATALPSVVLIDAAGRVVWQDVGTTPFLDFGYLLREAHWLLRPE